MAGLQLEKARKAIAQQIKNARRNMKILSVKEEDMYYLDEGLQALLNNIGHKLVKGVSGKKPTGPKPAYNSRYAFRGTRRHAPAGRSSSSPAFDVSRFVRKPGSLSRGAVSLPSGHSNVINMKKSGGAWVKEAREELIERIIQEIVAPRDPYKKTPGSMDEIPRDHKGRPIGKKKPWGSMDEIPRSRWKIRVPKMY